MGVTIKKHLWLPSLKKEWINLQKKNTSLSPFQYYDFVYQLWINYYPYILIIILIYCLDILFPLYILFMKMENS